MGGYGSSRWVGYSRRRSVEGCLTLVAPRTRRAESILDSVGGRFYWPALDYGFSYLIERQGDGYTLELIHGLTPQRVALIPTQPNYGGARWWFECPRCFRRAGRLYQIPRRGPFLCRLCHNLGYETSQIHRTGAEGIAKQYSDGGLLTPGQVLELFRSTNGCRARSHMVGTALAFPI